MNPTNLLMIFDMDGTLIQSNIDYMGIRDKLRAIIKNIVSSDEYNNIENTIYTILELLNLIKKNDLSGELHQKAWNLLEEYELRGYEKAFVEKDVIKTLERLKNKGHILTLYTNNSNKIAKYALQKYNFNHLFEYVLTRDDVTNSKPNPEGIFTLMERFHKTKTDTVFIGDSWVDAETAVNANVSFIYFGSEGAPGTRRKNINALATIDSMTDLLKMY